ncbi:MAG: PTS sugar transporter subunit IIA [Erysipelotrichaceae bacterium]|nr:PTS sugar transporter subunit IIA [Erysipelotrichaceae bacterium]
MNKLLKKIIDNKLTVYNEKFENWKDAIIACGVPLIEEGFITSDYIDAIIECIEKYGPYIVIAPDIAMPHSTENALGTLKTGIGFMKVAEPVVFDNNDREKDARLFFTLVSTNHEEHLANMVELSETLMNEDLVKDLLEVKCDEDFIKVAKKYNN